MNDQTPIREIQKPWGKEIWFAQAGGYCGKILHIKKGHQYSLQYHERKTETQYVIKGQVKFLLGPSDTALEEIILNPGDKLDVYPGMVHRAYGMENSEIFEVSTDHTDDVVKLSDDYGRSGKGNNFELDAKLAKGTVPTGDEEF